MKKQIFKEFITVKKVRYLPKIPPPPPPEPIRRLLVVGLCTLDMITVCDEYPAPSKIQRTTEGFLRLGGHAANISSVFRRLDKNVEFLGTLSSDPAFESLTTAFQARDINISSCPHTPHQPPHQIIVLVRGDVAGRSTVEYCDKKHELNYQQFVGAVDFRKYAWIHFVARNPKHTLRMIQAVRDYNARSQGANIIISIDLENLDPISLLMGALANYVFIRKQVKIMYGYMNGRELVWATRAQMRVVYKRWASRQPKKTPDPNEILPESEEPPSCTTEINNGPILLYDNYSEGASCLTADDNYFKVGSHKPEKIVDAIGEHDTFVGAFIYALQIVKMSVRDAMEYGTRATCHKLAFNGFDCLRCMPKDLISCYYA